MSNNFEGKNSIGDNCVISQSEIGCYTYIGSECRLDKVKIGRFCSIGSHVEVKSAIHPTDKFVSIHPAFYSTRKQSGVTFVTEDRFNEFIEMEDGYTAKIGNDVWIADNVIILGGITIGDGAVLATGSIVTKDVPPYAVVAGSPAKIIKYRFSEETVKNLLEIKWWNQNEKWLLEHLNEMQDIEKFMEVISKIE